MGVDVIRVISNTLMKLKFLIRISLLQVILIMTFVSLNAQNLTIIDITQAKLGEIPAETIFEKIEFVPLETHKDGLLNMKEATFYLSEKYIIGMNFLGGAYLFDRVTGKFIREISSFGPGPDEYTNPLYNYYGFDEENNNLFAGGTYTKYWECINIETNKMESRINKPLSENNNDFWGAYSPWFLKDNTYISFVNNRTGKDKIKLVVFDKEGNIMNRYPNSLEYNRDGMSLYPYFYGIFYYYNNHTYFKEFNYNDTVFYVDESKITPHIIFQLGNKQPLYQHQNDANYNKEKYLINFVYETGLFVLFNFTYFTETIHASGNTFGKNSTVHTGYFDKKSRQVYISSTPDLKKSGYTVNGVPAGFYPMSMNRNKEIIAKIDPAELIQNKEKIAPPFKDLFQNLLEDDNPIVVIAKLK